MHKLSLFITSIVILLALGAGSANAATEPTFPICANPQGTVKVNYDNGTHGVPGDTNTYTGKDTVYTLNDETLTQCLCASNGQGIQTNWWKAGNLNQQEIDVLITSGWIYVPNGTAWGLSEGPYLAKNSSYSCGGGSGGTGGGSSQGASASQSILALATTGNIKFIAALFVAGTALTLTGFGLSYKKRS